ncbi:MAG: hypothetical protein F4137_01780 [Acidobacteria bacterium]|nr:hypothetical protein [Acidobacteriota bacterium]
MALTDLLDKERSFKYLIGFVLAILFLALVAIPSRSLGGFYANLDALSDSVERGDYEQADLQLAEVTGFYERSRNLGLGMVSDAYLFADAFLQQASYNYLTGDFEAVVRDLADDIDDPRASHLLASAKFQLARLRYRAIADDDPDGQLKKAAIIEEVLDDVNADYERALRADATGRYDFKWNYDLTSDPEAVRRALEPLREAEPPQLEQMRGEGTPVRRRRG